MQGNAVKEKLSAGGIVVGPMVMEFFTAGIASIFAQTGVDYILYDLEHTGYGYEALREVVSYNRGLAPVPLVRVPTNQYTYLARAVDAGAKGVMVPFVETAAQAKAVVDAVKYPPLGRRGAGFGIAHDDYAGGDPAAKMEQANRDTLVIVQMESERTLAEIDAIAATPGVDVVFIGHFDLSNTMGLAGQVDHPRVQEASRRVIDACRRHNKAVGRMVMSEDAARRALDEGYRFICYATDVLLIQQPLAQAVAAIRAHRPEGSGP
jgi:2-keto-3-deoxy-L-rhamnonate aldolase RhmA